VREVNRIQTRLAEPKDAAQIAELFASGFRPEVRQLLVYGCKGAAEYIRMQLSRANSTTESLYVVAQTRSGIAGATELRRSVNRLFLNYIAVAPSQRGQGVGAILFSAALRMSEVRSGEIALDVLHDNVRALEWYSRLGFAAQASTEFLELAARCGADSQPAAPALMPAPPAYVAGLPQADVCQERFGFSKLDLITTSGNFSVGRIGETWFRLTEAAAISKPSVFAALNLLDPARRVFAVLPAGSAPPAQVIRLLAKTHRMGAEIPDLMSALSNDCQKSPELV
jgi:ribosomal protein S18 acetylase RimI-like enzyme